MATAIYGIIGYPVEHSFSANFFNSKFEKENIDAKYNLYPLKSIDEIIKLVDSTKNLKGLNVTIPYKEVVIPYLNDISEEASKIGAINVIKVIGQKENKEPSQDNKPFLKGYNTDVIGFRESLIPLLKPYMKKALILGTGGASKAVAFTLSQLGIEYKFVSRKKTPGNYTYSELTEKIISDNPLIINTTPLGMWPNIENKPDIPYSYLSSRHLCYDLVYNPTETAFMKEAEKKGAKVKNGLEMLHLQAVAAWNIWTS